MKYIDYFLKIILNSQLLIIPFKKYLFLIKVLYFIKYKISTYKLSKYLHYYIVHKFLGFLANIFWKNDININLNSLMQLKMFVDLQSHHDMPLLPYWFRSLVIDNEIIKNIKHGSMVYITFDTRTNVIRGPGIEIETLKTSTFPKIDPLPMNLNVQKVQFVEQPNPKIQVIFINYYFKL